MIWVGIVIGLFAGTLFGIVGSTLTIAIAVKHYSKKK